MKYREFYKLFVNDEYRCSSARSIYIQEEMDIIVGYWKERIKYHATPRPEFKIQIERV